MGKRLIVAVVGVVLLGGAYAAGAATHSSVTILSGHRLQELAAVSNQTPQSFQVPDQGGTAIPVPSAELKLRVNTGGQGIFDVRFSGTESGPNTPQVVIEVRVDGVAAAPVGQVAYDYSSEPPFAIERVVGPLAAGRHTVTITLQTIYAAGTGTYPTTLQSWTLVAEEVRANP